MVVVLVPFTGQMIRKKPAKRNRRASIFFSGSYQNEQLYYAVMDSVFDPSQLLWSNLC